MVYFTGDIHGRPFRIMNFCSEHRCSQDDIVIILGDVGANYYGGSRDDAMKMALNECGPTILCIHGNHEQRPQALGSYELIPWHGGQVWVEKQYPNLLFAKDGEIFDINGIRYLVIGGAYSVDKYYRLSRGWAWWANEQPDEEIKTFTEQQIASHQFDVVLSHTCPYKYEPREMFISGIDQSTVDTSTEEWLDSIEESINYLAWFCGHWHVDKRVDRMHFLFSGFESEDELHKLKEEHHA